MKEKIGGETFQIATNSETTVGELAERLIQILKKFGISKTKVRFSSPRVGDVLRNFSDTTKSQKILDWKAEIDLSEGLNQTVKWFLINLSNSHPI